MNDKYSSAILTINLQSVRNNYLSLKKMAANAKVAAVVKANAYGLGLKEIATTLVKEGCDAFFVANLDEALEFRRILTGPEVFVLHGLVSGQEEVFEAYNISPVINSVHELSLWQNHSLKVQKRLPCILHFDTGMNRLGLPADRWLDFRNNKIKPDQDLLTLQKLLSEPDVNNLEIKYIMSHLACSEDESNSFNGVQLKKFQSISRTFEGFRLSIANSGGIYLGAGYHFDLVRPGLAIYGVNPGTSHASPVENVIKLTSKILQIHFVDRPATVGYGAKTKVSTGAKIATIAVGYADGYMRSLSNNGVCAIEGVYVPVIGNVSMDLITLDVTKIPDENLTQDTIVEVIGENITVDMVARKAGTISYEILTSLGGRYKRVYKD